MKTEFEKCIKCSPPEILLTKRSYQTLAKLVREKNFSRKEWAYWITDMMYNDQYAMLDHTGNFICDPDDEDSLEAAFGNFYNFAWVQRLARFADKPPKRTPKKPMLIRLQILEVCFKLEAILK